MPSPKPNPNMLCAALKLVRGQPTHLNFQELRALGLRFGVSWERELEMAADMTTHHSPPLTMQFFQDAHGPRQGYRGAIECLRGYVGDDCAPGLTKEGCDSLETEWARIAIEVSNRCYEKEL